MSIKYLCIDDQQDKTLDALLGRLSQSGDIEFSRQTPVQLETQLDLVQKFSSENGEEMGLLLDLRLDMEADEAGNRVAYRGPTLAQELRTRMAEEGVRAFPIVLWSVNAKFKKSYAGDESSHDLFDAVFEKESEVAETPDEVAEKLKSLAVGYARLHASTSSEEISGLTGEAIDSPLYVQFLFELRDFIEKSAKHEVAHFILNELLLKEGLLVGDVMLAARLGVDIEQSTASWESLKQQLEKAKYSGVFCEGWPRWWWFKVEDWWNSLGVSRSGIRKLAASQRVEILNQTLGLELVAAEPILPTYSTKYSTLCSGTRKPLDPLDGFKVAGGGRRPWHDLTYVSAHAALERIGKDTWRLDPLELERLQRMKSGGTE